MENSTMTAVPNPAVKATNASGKVIKGVGIVLLVLVLAGSIGGFCFFYLQTQKLTTEIEDKNRQVQAVRSKLQDLEKNVDSYLLLADNKTCNNPVNECLSELVAQYKSIAESFRQIAPEGPAAQTFGSGTNQYKLQSIASANIDLNKDIGCSGQISPQFARNFYTNDESATGFCVNSSLLGSSQIKLVSFDFELKGSMPQLVLNYDIKESDSGEANTVTAKTFLPFENGIFSFTSIDTNKTTGRMVFMVPRTQQYITLVHPLGKIVIDLNNKSVGI